MSGTCHDVEINYYSPFLTDPIGKQGSTTLGCEIDHSVLIVTSFPENCGDLRPTTYIPASVDFTINFSRL